MSSESSSARRVCWAFLGRVGYAEATALQVAVREGVKRQTGDEHLLLLEHPHVYTLGRNADVSDVVATKAWLALRGVEVHETDRGGQVTYHGPGQLVGYPILDLAPDRRDLRRYVRDLCSALIRTLAEYGIAARVGETTETIGVWVDGRKIGSLGIHLSRWVTTHGFALNVTTDLSYFSGIVPCGLTGVEMTSIERLTGRRPALEEVGRKFVRHFAELFDRAPVEVAADEVLAACPSVS